MFLNICHALNQIGLSWVVAFLRRVLAVGLPLTAGLYAHPEQVGYRGWVDSPVGALAFIREDGSLQWRW